MLSYQLLKTDTFERLFSQQSVVVVKMSKSAFVFALVLLLQLGALHGDAASFPTGAIFGQTLLGGEAVGGPVTIRESTVGDIINITVNINGTVHSEVTVEFLNVLIGALNDYGSYGITLSDLRGALINYVAKQGGNF